MIQRRRRKIVVTARLLGIVAAFALAVMVPAGRALVAEPTFGRDAIVGVVAFVVLAVSAGTTLYIWRKIRRIDRIPPHREVAARGSGSVAPGPRKRNILVFSMLTAALALGGAACTPADLFGGHSEVIRVIDGDTIEVRRGDEQVVVRLLNVDAPETVHPNGQDECLGSEASEYLRRRLPPGTRVELEYDVERLDHYGRELAGVFLEGSLVNAEIAREGLGMAVVYGENSRFYDEVLAAQRQAEADGIGLFDPSVDCTFVGQLTALEESAAQLLAVDTSEMDLEGMEGHAAETATLLLAVDRFVEWLWNEDTELSGQHARDRYSESAQELRQALTEEEERTNRAVSDEKDRAAEEKRRAEEARLEEREAREAAERAEQEQSERQHAARPTDTAPAAPAPAAPRPAPPAPPAPVASGDAYTGCRAYGGNYIPNAIDNQGRPYTRIDCTTKLPLP